MKHLISLILVMSYLTSYSQDNWCHYETSFAGTHYAMIESCGDTLIDGLSYTKLIKTSYYLGSLSVFYTEKHGYLRYSGDTAFFARHNFNSFYEEVLYTFNVDVGHVFPADDLQDEMEVTAIDTMTILGVDRKVIYMDNNDPMNYNQDIWVEGIGSIVRSFTFPRATNSALDFYLQFSCFIDGPTEGIYIPNNDVSCYYDQIESQCEVVLQTSNLLVEDAIKISPNPFTNHLQVNGIAPSSTLNIFTIDGRFLEEYQMNQGENYINTSHLEKGIYMLEVLSSGEKVAVRKMIKM